MANTIQSATDLNAPPVTKILADYVAQHPSQGWASDVEHEAHRTFLNWLGCAIGAANHERFVRLWERFKNFRPHPKRQY